MLYIYLVCLCLFAHIHPKNSRICKICTWTLTAGEVDDVSRLQNVVSEFYHPQRPATQRRIRLVIVGPDEPTRELKGNVKNSLPLSPPSLFLLLSSQGV